MIWITSPRIASRLPLFWGIVFTKSIAGCCGTVDGASAAPETPPASHDNDAAGGASGSGGGAGEDLSETGGAGGESLFVEPRCTLAEPPSIDSC
jgi:hypothetical protein